MNPELLHLFDTTTAQQEVQRNEKLEQRNKKPQRHYIGRPEYEEGFERVHESAK
jgi:hypothetical protein